MDCKQDGRPSWHDLSCLISASHYLVEINLFCLFSFLGVIRPMIKDAQGNKLLGKQSGTG